MKNKSLLFASMIVMAFASCSDDETQYSIAPELEVYVSTFIAEAQERGVTITQNNLIAEITSYKAQSIANGALDGDQKYLYVNEGIFKFSTTTGNTNLLEYSIFNELGGLFIHNRVNVDQYERESFFNELIK